MNQTSWSNGTHEEFIEALINEDFVQVETTCRRLVQNALLFIREINYTFLPRHVEELEHVADFICTIYSVAKLPLDKLTANILDSMVGVGVLITEFQRCVHRATDCATSIGFLVKLGEFLRAEAITLTTDHYRSFKEFIKSPINTAISKAIGDDILACTQHQTADSLRITENLEIEFPLDTVPDDLLLCHIASGFDVQIETLKPIEDFDAILRIRFAVAMLKNENSLLDFTREEKSRRRRKSSLSIQVS